MQTQFLVLGQFVDPQQQRLARFQGKQNPECLIERRLVEEWPMTYLCTTKEGTEEVLSKTYFRTVETEFENEQDDYEPFDADRIPAALGFPDMFFDGEYLL